MVYHKKYLSGKELKNIIYLRVSFKKKTIVIMKTSSRIGVVWKSRKKNVKRCMSMKYDWWHCTLLSGFGHTILSKASETLLSSLLIASINNKVRFVKISLKNHVFMRKVYNKQFSYFLTLNWKYRVEYGEKIRVIRLRASNSSVDMITRTETICFMVVHQTTNVSGFSIHGMNNSKLNKRNCEKIYITFSSNGNNGQCTRICLQYIKSIQLNTIL